MISLVRQICGFGGAVLLLAAGCANPHRSEGISLADAIRVAGAHAEGSTAVAAGAASETGSGDFQVAFLAQGRVKEVDVDPRSGGVSRTKDRSVQEGSEAFAAELERLLPGAKIDLARAVEIALDNASNARAVGVEIDAGDGVLAYLVTLHAGSTSSLTTIDAATGAILHVEEHAGSPDEEMDEVDGERGEAGESSETEESGEAGELLLGFETEELGARPSGWLVPPAQGGAPGTECRVVADATVPGASEGRGRALEISGAGSGAAGDVHPCWTDRVRFQDGSIEADFRPIQGGEGERCGLLWRAKDARTFYACGASPVDGRLRVDAVEAGIPRELAAADADIQVGGWHRLRVEQDGIHILCSLDGEKILDLIDDTLPAAGGVGFWTLGSSRGAFAGLRVRPLRSPAMERSGERSDEPRR